MTRWASFLLAVAGVASLAAFAALVHAQTMSSEAMLARESEIIDYLQESTDSGQMVPFRRLATVVFSAPEDREILDRLWAAYRRLPFILDEFEKRVGRNPTRAEVAEQLDVESKTLDVLLGILFRRPAAPEFVREDLRNGTLALIDEAILTGHIPFRRLNQHRVLDWAGKPAPALAAATFDGEPVSLADYAGNVVVLQTWFTNCAPCVSTMRDLAAMHHELYRDDLVFLGANGDGLMDLYYDASDRGAYLRQTGATFPELSLTLDDYLALGIPSVFPTTFVIGRDGAVADVFVHLTPREEIEAAIQRALAPGEPGSD